MSAMVMLPDGQNVNLCTNEGASAFLSASPQFVSSWTEQASEILQHTSRNIKSKNNQLVVLYKLLGVMAESLTSEQLATLDQDQFQCLVDSIKSRFSEVSSSPSWRSTGTLAKPDQELLDTIVPWLKHSKFVQLMISSDGFEVIADLVARDENNKPTMPIPEVTETILMITNNAILTLKGMSSTEAFSKKKALVELDETGLLGQALRCLTVPVTHGSLTHYLQIIDMMEKDTRLIQTRLAPGTRTGDILEGLLAGKDGWTAKSNPNLPQTMKRLEALHKLAVMATKCAENDIELTRVCRQCGKTGYEKRNEDGSRLLPCSKCKSTYYCDKTCQKADWKAHKQTCNPFQPKLPVQSIIMSFIQQNYVEIMTKIQETCVDRGLEKKDVFLEIDFFKRLGDEDVSPAMDGKFRVAPVSLALEGDRLEEPDWFYRGTNVYESNVALFREGMRDHHNRMTPNHVLVAYRGTEGHAGVYRVDMMSEKTGFHICSDEALELFPQDTLEKRMKLMLLQSGRQPVVGGESEEDLKRFMKMFGAGMNV